MYKIEVITDNQFIRIVSVLFQELYCVRSDLGNLLKALGRLDEAKVKIFFLNIISMSICYHVSIPKQLMTFFLFSKKLIF